MADTPKFDRPPVVETVIGVHFPELPGFRPRHFYLYWETCKEHYPIIKEQPRIGAVVEAFPRRPVLPGPRLSFLKTPTPDRVWCVSEPENELIQIQPDWFLFNWRERPGSEYTSFAENSKKFRDEFSRFCEFCRAPEQNLEEPQPKLCEVSYVNHIRPEEGESATELFGRVFSGLRWETADGWLPVPESAVFNRVFVIGDQLGRLYAEAAIASPGNGGNGAEFVLLKLTARVNQKSQDSRELMTSLQLAHDWAVRGFASVTDGRIQGERWGRRP